MFLHCICVVRMFLHCICAVRMFLHCICAVRMFLHCICAVQMFLHCICAVRMFFTLYLCCTDVFLYLESTGRYFGIMVTIKITLLLSLTGE